MRKQKCRSADLRLCFRYIDIYTSQNLPLNANFHYKTFNLVVKPKPKCGSGICFQFHTPGTKENIFSQKNVFGKKSCFLPKITNFWNFQKVSLRLQRYVHQFDYASISAMRCTGERGQMTKLEKVATMHNCNFMGGCFLYLCKNNLQKTLTKANMFVK